MRGNSAKHSVILHIPYGNLIRCIKIGHGESLYAYQNDTDREHANQLNKGDAYQNKTEPCIRMVQGFLFLVVGVQKESWLRSNIDLRCHQTAYFGPVKTRLPEGLNPPPCRVGQDRGSNSFNGRY